MRTLAAAAVSLALALGLALCSRLPYVAEPSDQARVRLSWRAALERVEVCREPSAEEQAALPPHMRRPRICEGRTLPFRLRVSLDGERRFDALIRAAGARADRPAYVYQELRVAPGEHRLQVSFATEDVETPDAEPRLALALDEAVTLAARDVLLVTHDPGSDRLHLVASATDRAPWTSPSSRP